MDPITRFCAFVLSIGAFALFVITLLAFAYLLYVIGEAWDKHSKKRCQKIIDENRKAFKLELDRVGKDLMLHDELQELKEKSVRFQPIRKAVGHFSDAAAQLLVQ